MLIAELSTLISSIALIGVAVSLYLQSRQLRASQIQITAASQIELMRLALDYPAATAPLMGGRVSESAGQYVALNWQFTHLRTTYVTRTSSDKYIHFVVRHVFENDIARDWWAFAGPSYIESSMTRREKHFAAIVNEEYQRSQLVAEPVDPAPGSTGKADPPPRSS